MVELAVVSPVLIALAFMGAWLTELVRARLVNQSVAHGLVWQLAGRLPPESDWEAERDRSLAEAAALPPEVTGRVSFHASLERTEADLRYPAPAPGASALAAAFLQQGSRSILQQWNSVRADQLEARSDVQLVNPLPLPWRETGRVDGMLKAALEARETLRADDGHLEDGRDVQPGTRDAGRGLWRRVHPLSFLGRPGSTPSALQLLGSLPLLPAPLPSLTGTFLAVHAYRPEPATAAHCDGIPGYLRAVGSESGLQDFMAPGSGGEWLDAAHPQCFDTLPFRDVHAYPQEGGSPGNLSMQLFQHRGQFYLGCRLPQAVACEGDR